jgi:hypothetical protein
MIEFGPHFNPAGLRPEITMIVSMIEDAVGAYTSKPAILTSGTDRTHGWGSLHYVGQGLDFRWDGYSMTTAHLVASQLRSCLGKHYDVVVEDDHIHVEFQPKRVD